QTIFPHNPVLTLSGAISLNLNNQLWAYLNQDQNKTTHFNRTLYRAGNTIMEQFEAFLAAYGLIAIFALLLVKGIGVPIPIPADAILLIAAARCAEGSFSLAPAFIVILTAMMIGGAIQFALVKAAGRGFLYRFGGYLGLTPERLDRLTEKMKSSSIYGIGIAILTPGVRSVTIPACGLSGVPSRSFLAGLLLGSGLFLSLHFFLGYVGRSLLQSLGISVEIALAILVILAVVGLGVWVIIRRRRHPEATTGELVAEAFQCWHEATCPACLALAAASHLDVTPPQLHHSH
ncbi:MAG TPA: VTT domain-containing protein, partial [Phototrophicaceae bacterium]|nr:VTT domain-containing protein [Phototrophicaceae bacterium]